jgi:hypothetical protein
MAIRPEQIVNGALLSKVVVLTSGDNAGKLSVNNSDAAESFLNLSATQNRIAAIESADRTTSYVTASDKAKWDDVYSKASIEAYIEEQFAAHNLSVDWKEAVNTLSDLYDTYGDKDDVAARVAAGQAVDTTGMSSDEAAAAVAEAEAAVDAPEPGWTVVVQNYDGNGTQATFRYTGAGTTGWERITFRLSDIPAASANANGLMSSTDYSKLAAIEANANNYVHPDTHAATMIVEDTTHRFVSDTDIANWNQKINRTLADARYIKKAAHTFANEVISVAGMSGNVMTLAHTPNADDFITVTVNGVVYNKKGTEFTVSGTSLTWSGGFTLESTDSVVVSYFYTATDASNSLDSNGATPAVGE